MHQTFWWYLIYGVPVALCILVLGVLFGLVFGFALHATGEWVDGMSELSEPPSQAGEGEKR
jgi:ABC-type amino acid transport system permease subunit